MYLVASIKAMVSGIFATFLCRPWLAVLLGALLTASFSQAHETERESCHFVTGITSAADDLSFSPYDMNFSATSSIGDSIFLTLFDLTKTGDIKPRFAKKWQFNEKDNTIVIDLDDRCRWSDGAKITAKDMVDGIRLMFTNPDIYVVGRENFGSGAEVLKGKAPISSLGIRVINEDRFEIDLAGSKDLLMKALSHKSYTPVPNHLIDAGKTVWPSKALLPVTSGTYIASLEKSPESKIKLSQNPHYCSHIPVPLTTVDMLTDIPTRAIVREFISKKIDVVSRVPSRYIQSLDKRKADDKSYTIGSHVSLENETVYYLFINQLKPELTDARVKSAIRLAIDHELYLSSAMFGSLASRMTSYTPPYKRYYPGNYDYGTSDYKSRITEAKALMSEAGYSEKNPLILDMPVRKNHYFKPMAEALAGMLKQVYIKPELRDAGEGEHYYKNLDEGNFGVGFFMWSADIPDPSNYLSGILGKKFIDNKTHQDLHDRIIESGNISNVVKRYSLLAEIEAELRNIGHIIPLYAVYRTWALRKPFRFGQLNTLNVRNIESEDCLSKTQTINQIYK